MEEGVHRDVFRRERHEPRVLDIFLHIGYLGGNFLIIK
jgi:hypothetical protein